MESGCGSKELQVGKIIDFDDLLDVSSDFDHLTHIINSIERAGYLKIDKDNFLIIDLNNNTCIYFSEARFEFRKNDEQWIIPNYMGPALVQFGLLTNKPTIDSYKLRNYSVSIDYGCKDQYKVLATIDSGCKEEQYLDPNIDYEFKFGPNIVRIKKYKS